SGGQPTVDNCDAIVPRRLVAPSSAARGAMRFTSAAISQAWWRSTHAAWCASPCSPNDSYVVHAVVNASRLRPVSGAASARIGAQLLSNDFETPSWASYSLSCAFSIFAAAFPHAFSALFAQSSAASGRSHSRAFVKHDSICSRVLETIMLPAALIVVPHPT